MDTARPVKPPKPKVLTFPGSEPQYLAFSGFEPEYHPEEQRRQKSRQIVRRPTLRNKIRVNSKISIIIFKNCDLCLV